MIDLMSELKRIIKPAGTIWINLGDSYSKTVNINNNGTGKTGLNNNSGVNAWEKVRNHTKRRIDGIICNTPDKSLMFIPHRFAIRCVDELGLICRNDIIWAKRNGMPESVTDRFSKKHEFFFFFVKSQKYYFDIENIRDEHIWAKLDKRSQVPGGVRHKTGLSLSGQYANDGVGYNPNGKNPGDVADFWDINTKPSKSNHYATYNHKLIDKPIIAGCPKGGIILDPFCGTGTTLVRALQLERKVIGIDGKAEYVKDANKNIEPYLIQQTLYGT
jgi:site-specific DNA-methyltransferase (cytosine-N4-specific)